jgi:hypothetical protein
VRSDDEERCSFRDIRHQCRASPLLLGNGLPSSLTSLLSDTTELTAVTVLWRVARTVRLAAAARSGACVFGQLANDTRRPRIQNGLMQLNACCQGLCSLQPLVLGRPLSHWHVPLTLSSTAAVRSRADGSGPLAATFAVAVGSA